MSKSTFCVLFWSAPEHRFSPVRRRSPAKFRRRVGSGDTMESDTTESETSVVEPCGRRKNTIDEFLEGETDIKGLYNC